MAAADPGLITHLNNLLRTKLTGINQYFLHARMLKHAGNVKLADYQFKASIDIMKHSDMLVEHILSLGGAPNLQELGKLMIGDTVETMLSNDLTLSESALAQLKNAIAYCEANAENKAHFATVGMLRKILEGQHEQSEFIKAQLATLSASHTQKDCA